LLSAATDKVAAAAFAKTVGADKAGANITSFAVSVAGVSAVGSAKTGSVSAELIQRLAVFTVVGCHIASGFKISVVDRLELDGEYFAACVSNGSAVGCHAFNHFIDSNLFCRVKLLLIGINYGLFIFEILIDS